MGCNGSNELVDVTEEEELQIMAGRMRVTVGAGPYAMLGPRRPKTPVISPRKSKRVENAENIDELLASSPELESVSSEKEDEVSNRLDDEVADEVHETKEEVDNQPQSDTLSEFTLSDLQSLTSTQLAQQDGEIPFEVSDPSFRPVRESIPRIKFKEGNYYPVTLSPIESTEDLQETTRINEEIMEMAKFDEKVKEKKIKSNSTSRRKSKLGSKLSLGTVKTVRIAPDVFSKDIPGDTKVQPDYYDIPMDGRINKQLG